MENSEIVSLIKVVLDEAKESVERQSKENVELIDFLSLHLTEAFEALERKNEEKIKMVTEKVNYLYNKVGYLEALLENGNIVEREERVSFRISPIDIESEKDKDNYGKRQNNNFDKIVQTIVMFLKKSGKPVKVKEIALELESKGYKYKNYSEVLKIASQSNRSIEKAYRGYYQYRNNK